MEVNKCLFTEIDLRHATQPQYDEDENRDQNSHSSHNQTQQQTHIPAIEADFNLSEHQLQTRTACLQELDNLHRDLQDLHGIFHQLHETVQVQGETVTQVAQHVEETQVAVEQGESSLRQALRYKKAMYPMCGAIIGTFLGGPLGMVAGMKAGGIAAVGIGCGILGFTGGSAIKNSEQVELDSGGPESALVATEEDEQQKSAAERKRE